MKNKSVLKNINKWKAKAQELNSEVNQEISNNKSPAGSNKPFREEKVQILNKIVKPYGSVDEEPEEDEDTKCTESDTPIKTLDDIIKELKQQYEQPTGKICRLCKRDLSTPEKLQLHFNLSKIHEVSYKKIISLLLF